MHACAHTHTQPFIYLLPVCYLYASLCLLEMISSDLYFVANYIEEGIKAVFHAYLLTSGFSVCAPAGGFSLSRSLWLAGPQGSASAQELTDWRACSSCLPRTFAFSISESSPLIQTANVNKHHGGVCEAVCEVGSAEEVVFRISNSSSLL